MMNDALSPTRPQRSPWQQQRDEADTASVARTAMERCLPEAWVRHWLLIAGELPSQQGRRRGRPVATQRGPA